MDMPCPGEAAPVSCLGQETLDLHAQRGVVGDHRELREFLHHVGAWTKQDALVGSAQHGRVVVRIADGAGAEVQQAERGDRLALLVSLTQTVAGDPAIRVDLQAVTEDGRPAHLGEEGLGELHKGVGQDNDLGMIARPGDELDRARQWIQPTDDLVDGVDADAVPIKDLQPTTHQLVVIGLVTGGPAELGDAGPLGDADPDLRGQHPFHVEGDDGGVCAHGAEVCRDRSGRKMNTSCHRPFTQRRPALRRTFPASAGYELDLVPLIDVVFLILLFFILCGRLTIQERTEQISVPPARTASVQSHPDHVLLNIRGDDRPLLSLGGDGQWLDPTEPATWIALRWRMDQVWMRSDKVERDGQTVADTVIELRADGSATFGLIQVAQQIISGSVDPVTFLPRRMANNPFVMVDLTARAPL